MNPETAMCMGLGWRWREWWAAAALVAAVAFASPVRAQDASRAAGPDAAADRELLKDVEPPATTGPSAAGPHTTGPSTKPAAAPEAADREQRLRAVEAQLRELLKSMEDLRQGGAAPAAQTGTQPAAPAASPPSTRPADPAARIRDEGFNRSQVMQTASYLTDVIGPRLTGSPNLRRANEWTRDRLSSWGLGTARLEAWGPFGRGWSLRRFSAQVVEPQAIPLIAAPKAWSPGLEGPLAARVVHLDARTDAELEKFKGKLKGAIVMVGSVREVQARFEAPAVRVTEGGLLRLANADAARSSPPGRSTAEPAAARREAFASTPTGEVLLGAAARAATRPTTAPADGRSDGPTTRRGPATRPSSSRLLSFAAAEGAAAVVTPSSQGDGGTFYVGSASLPGFEGRSGGGRPDAPRVWSADAPPMPPQVTLATEDFNRLARMIQQGVEPKVEIDLRVQYHDDDLMAYNTVAEIPGGDLKDEIVMLGAHLDSWHAGTGATDNAAGCAAVMEAVRIIRALDLKPRRTIRVALWTGEEQGLYGSKAYVARHFGYYPEADSGRPRGTRGGDAGGDAKPTSGPTTRPASRPSRQLVRKDDYEKLSVYFNLDNGTGKIRGVYMQGNEAVRPIFRRWLAPFEDLGATTLSLSATGGTDHTSFDAVGLPGFQFIQDPIEYWTRTHHSNADVYDRLQAEDLKQASVILATFAYNAAMADEKIPRKRVE